MAVEKISEFHKTKISVKSNSLGNYLILALMKHFLDFFLKQLTIQK